MEAIARRVEDVDKQTMHRFLLDLLVGRGSDCRGHSDARELDSFTVHAHACIVWISHTVKHNAHP